MNNLDKDYINLLEDIIKNGTRKSDRTGTGTISVFGRQIRHNMSEGFPLLTTKKMHWKSIVTELLWFLRGDTNIKFLVDNDCHIWNGDAIKNYEKHNGEIDWGPFVTKQEAFVDKIKTDDEFARTWGELGPIYGNQWRKWKGDTWVEGNTDGTEGFYLQSEKIDQISNLINDLKTNPDSRRLMVSAWNVGELDQMALPPCHYGFQVYTRELSLKERNKWAWDNWGITCEMESVLDVPEVPKRAISLMWNQRSVDTFLGLPFNIASYGLLLEIIAKEVNMVPDELIGNLGDVHLYSNHVEQAKEQIGRDYTSDERSQMLEDSMGSKNYRLAVADLMPFGGGMSEYFDLYKIPYRTRTPFKLPRLTFLDEYHYINDKELVGEIPFSEKINNFRTDFFKIENYESHPSIKAPLSN